MKRWLPRRNGQPQVDYGQLATALIQEIAGAGDNNFNDRLERLERTVEVAMEMMVSLETRTGSIEEGVDRNHSKRLIGKKEELNPEMVADYKKKDYEDLRLQLNKNANLIAKGKGVHVRHVRNQIYTKVKDILGYDVFEVGPKSLYDRDRKINRGSSLVNSLIIDGYIAEAVVISEDMKGGR